MHGQMARPDRGSMPCLIAPAQVISGRWGRRSWRDATLTSTISDGAEGGDCERGVCADDFPRKESGRPVVPPGGIRKQARHAISGGGAGAKHEILRTARGLPPDCVRGGGSDEDPSPGGTFVLRTNAPLGEFYHAAEEADRGAERHSCAMIQRDENGGRNARPPKRFTQLIDHSDVRDR